MTFYLWFTILLIIPVFHCHSLACLYQSYILHFIQLYKIHYGIYLNGTSIKYVAQFHVKTQGKLWMNVNNMSNNYRHYSRWWAYTHVYIERLRIWRVTQTAQQWFVCFKATWQSTLPASGHDEANRLQTELQTKPHLDAASIQTPHSCKVKALPLILTICFCPHVPRQVVGWVRKVYTDTRILIGWILAVAMVTWLWAKCVEERCSHWGTRFVDSHCHVHFAFTPCQTERRWFFGGEK